MRKVIDEKNTALLYTVVKDAKSIGIDFFNRDDVIIDEEVYQMSRKHTLGLCKRRRNMDGMYVYSIFFSTKFSTISEQEKKNVLMHELIHTLPNCFNHKSEFKRMMNYVNAKLPEYNVTVRSKEKNDEDKEDKALNMIRKALSPVGEINGFPVYEKPFLYMFNIGHKNGNVKKVYFLNLIKEHLRRKEYGFIKYIYETRPDLYRFIVRKSTKKMMNEINKIVNQ